MWGKAKVLKPSEPVVRFTQSTFELLLELPVFFFQFFDASFFGEDHQVLTRICFACRTSHPFTYPLFQFLLPEGPDTIPQEWLTVQIRFADACRLCYRVVNADVILRRQRAEIRTDSDRMSQYTRRTPSYSWRNDSGLEHPISLCFAGSPEQMRQTAHEWRLRARTISTELSRKRGSI